MRMCKETKPWPFWVILIISWFSLTCQTEASVTSLSKRITIDYVFIILSDLGLTITITDKIESEGPRKYFVKHSAKALGWGQLKYFGFEEAFMP